MTDEEVIIFYDKLSNYFGDKLVDFEQYPNIFAYQVKMYKYYEMPKPIEESVTE
jgi:hypothetical protein